MAWCALLGSDLGALVFKVMLVDSLLIVAKQVMCDDQHTGRL